MSYRLLLDSSEEVTDAGPIEIKVDENGWLCLHDKYDGHMIVIASEHLKPLRQFLNNHAKEVVQ